MIESHQKNPQFEHLFEHNPVFRQLSTEHRMLKREADMMNRTLYLSPAMETKMHEIKKRKLEIKDQMESMLAGMAP